MFFSLKDFFNSDIEWQIMTITHTQVSYFVCYDIDSEQGKLEDKNHHHDAISSSSVDGRPSLSLSAANSSFILSSLIFFHLCVIFPIC